MVFWYVWLYSLRKIPAAISIPISIVVAIMIGYFPEVGRELALQRACVFFPYFLIGYHLPKHFFDIFKSRTMRYLGLAALFILFIYVVKIDGANKYWFFGSKPYHDFMDFPEFGALIRGLFYLLSVIGVCGFLGVVPTNKYWFTKYGANTLNVYLFHGFIVKLLRRYFPFEAISFIPAIITFSFFALGLTVLLASERFKKWTSSLLNLF
ncbi:acyltransferase family protein [Vagococcus zengguangii]|nr:hypothetical protein [Vagococcus zengguangii]TLG78337.1 hypothetical protein FE258_09245 [Vagococcus zengguangii]